MLAEVYMILLQSLSNLKLEVNEYNVSSQSLLSCSLVSRTFKSKLGQFDHLFYMIVTLHTNYKSVQLMWSQKCLELRWHVCSLLITLSLVIDTGHSKSPRMEARNMFRNLVGKPCG